MLFMLLCLNQKTDAEKARKGEENFIPQLPEPRSRREEKLGQKTSLCWLKCLTNAQLILVRADKRKHLRNG